MIQIVRLNRKQEDALQATAERFVAECEGDVWKALKSMIVLNGELTEKLAAARTVALMPAPSAISTAPVKPTRKPRPAVQQQFRF